MDDIIAETEGDMMGLTQPSNKCPTEFAKALWNKAIMCKKEFDGYVIKDLFTHELSELLRRCMRAYLEAKKNAAVHDLARHAILVTKLDHGSSNADASNPHGSTDIRRRNAIRRVDNINNINLNSYSYIKYSCMNALLSQPRSPLSTSPIWQKQLQRPPQKFSAQSAPTSVNDAPFFRFCSASHPAAR